jgi:hypothetical protein
MALKGEKSMRACVLLLLVIGIILLNGPCTQAGTSPQDREKNSVGESSDKYRERIENLAKGKPGTETAPEKEPSIQPGTDKLEPIFPQAPSPEMLDQKTKEVYLAALHRYYEYRISGFDHRRRVFEWQHLSSKIIFVTVLVLVFVGIYFAAVQFHTALRRKSEGETSKSGEVTEFSATVEGIKVSSPVLGVIILVISLAFFYLYLSYVYPITEIF